MKVNLTGFVVEQKNLTVNRDNGVFVNGDGVREILRINNGIIVNWEDHYFNLMSSMRIYRMNIPLDFTPEFFQEQINLLVNENQVISGKVDFFVFRSDYNNFLNSKIDFIIKIYSSENNWEFLDSYNEIDVYKDYTINSSFYSLVNGQKPEENIAEIYRLENGYADLILLNSNKRMARTLKGNIFIISGNDVRTPKKEEGVINSVLRNKFIAKINGIEEFKIQEDEIFPYEIQKADEIFILIDGIGIMSISKNRKKEYPKEKTKLLYNYLKF